MRRTVGMMALLALVCMGSPASAADPDTVVLTSGNRLTGSVSKLARGELTFSIDGAGSVDIDWNNVASLQSTRSLDIELASGERLAGTLAPSDSGKLEVRTEGGPKVLDMKEVVGIVSVGATIVDRTSGSIDFGLQLLQAGKEIDFTLNAEAANRTKNFLTKASYSGLLRRRDGTTAHSRHHFDLGTRRFLSNRWFYLGKFLIEQNRELELDLRFLAGGALGRTLVQSQRTVLAVYAGLDYDLEQYEPVPDTEHSAEALGTLEWDWFELGGSTVFTVAATTYVKLGESRVRFDLESSIRRDIVENIYVSLDIFAQLDSDPPAAGLESDDFGMGVTIGRSF